MLTCALLLAQMVTSAVVLAQPERAHAVFPEAVFDFGEVDAGVPLQHVFQVGNRGTAPLKIHRVDSTCACTVAGFDTEIAPGKVGEIRIDLVTDGQEGAFAIHLHAYTSDPDVAEMTLTLKADLKVGLQARPGYVRFVETTGFEDPIVDVQVVVARDGAPFSIRSIDVPFPFLEAAYREARGDERRDDVEGPQYAVEVRLLPDAPEGPLEGFVEIRTNHPRQDTLSVPLNGFIRPPFEVHPDAVDLGSFDSGTAHRTSVRVRSRIDTAADALVRAETDVAGVEIEIVKDDRDSSLYFVVVRAEPQIEAGAIDGTLRISAPLSERQFR